MGIRSHHGPAPAALPREPRDPGRPQLHAVSDLDDPADLRLSACPVCGMDGDEVTLDGKFWDAWPAHATCVEWLGEWAAPAANGHVPVKLPAAAAVKTVASPAQAAALALVHDHLATTFSAFAPIQPEVAAPVIARWCICGMKFTGTIPQIRAAENAHISSGTCALHKHPGRR